MTTTTARVDVLTAEVRVLVVGSRQVTLSVYGQLDHVKPGEIDPFGRVAPRDAETGNVYVVGMSIRQRDHGSLVRSRRESCSLLARRADVLRARADMTAEHRELIQQNEAMKQTRPEPSNDPEWWERRGAIGTRIDQLDVWLRHETRTVEELLAESGAVMDAAEAAAPWEALPLIVLAGLR